MKNVFKYGFLFGILIISMVSPFVVLANDMETLVLENLITDRQQYNHGSLCNFQFNVRNPNDYNIQDVNIIIKISRNGVDVPLTSEQSGNYPTLATAKSPNTQYRSFNLSVAGDYKIEVWINGTTKYVYKIVKSYATDISLNTDKQTYSKYENEIIEFSVTVSNMNANASLYTVEIYLTTPSGSAYVETNSSYTINSIGSKTFTRSYRIKSSDVAGMWTYKVKAFPTTASGAYAEKQMELTIEDVKYNLAFIPPNDTKYNMPILAYASISNAGTNPVYVNLGFVLFSTTGTGGVLMSGELTNITVKSSSIGKVETVTMYLQQMATRQVELPVGTYRLTLYGKVIGSDDEPISQEYLFNIIENIPASDTSMYMITEKPVVNQNVEFEFVVFNKELDKDIVIDNLIFYVQNPSDRTVYNYEDNNVLLERRGEYESSQSYHIMFKPTIPGTYTLFYRYNKGSEKKVSSFNVVPGADTLIGITGVTFSPSNVFTNAESVEIKFTISNLGAVPKAISYNIYANDNKSVGLSGTEMVGGSVEKVEVRRVINGSQFVAQQDIPVTIVVSGDFPEVKYPTSISVTNPSGQRSKLLSAKMNSFYYQVGTTGTLSIRLQGGEKYAVTNYVTVMYPSSGSATGEKRVQVNLSSDGESKLVEIPIEMKTIANGVGVTVQLEGTRGEAVDQSIRLQFDILSPQDFNSENQSARTIGFWRSIAIYLAFIFVGAIVTVILIFKVVKKKKVKKEEPM